MINMLEGITVLNELTANVFNANTFVLGFLISVFVELAICVVLALSTEFQVH